MIKKCFVPLIGLFLVGSILAQGISYAETEEKYIEPIAYISYLEGSVDLNFEKAEINMILMTADELKTENGRIEVKMDQVCLRLDKRTTMVFVVLENGIKTIRIKYGNVYLQIKNGEIATQTPHKQDILSTGSHLIEVKEETKIYSNPKVPFDDFLSWNFKRNDELNRRSRTRYLPEELNDYEYTLYNYGSWRYDAIYGYVWIPRVDSGWRPYFYGRWVWYPILGWTWVSYEPFGWSVYHYGRWQWDVGYGWYWIPTRYWGPGWVYWHPWSGYYSWCPMWYDNDYYNRYFGRYYSNIGNTNIWTTVSKNQLSSRNVAKSVVSKSRLSNSPKISTEAQLTTNSNSKIRISSKSPILNRSQSISAKNRISPRSSIAQTRTTTQGLTTQISMKQTRTKITQYQPSGKINTTSRTYRTSPKTTITQKSYSFRSSVRSYNNPQVSRYSRPSIPKFRSSFSKSLSSRLITKSHSSSKKIRKK